uniref:Uncharacterized protein n=1 Tax=Arundo donax TaxID=35708 RepID=A0A0A8ZJZ2_ARUDO
MKSLQSKQGLGLGKFIYLPLNRSASLIKASIPGRICGLGKFI